MVSTSLSSSTIFLSLEATVRAVTPSSLATSVVRFLASSLRAEAILSDVHRPAQAPQFFFFR